MDPNSIKKDNSEQISLINLVKKYTSKANERDIPTNSTAQQSQQKKQTATPEKSKTSLNKSKSTTNSLLSDLNEQMNDDNDANVNYKAKYRELEKKYHQLENGTVKQLQNKIGQLEREVQQMKIIKDRITEICACRHLTDRELEQLKSLVNSNQSPTETIANKTDFLQQTKKLRDILKEHNDELLNKINQLLKNKRKRSQYENDSDDEQ